MVLISPVLSTFFAIGGGLLLARTVFCRGAAGSFLATGPRLGQFLTQHETPLALAVLDVGLAVRAATARDDSITVSGP